MKKVSFLKHIAHFLKCVFLFSGKINMNTTNKPRTFLGTTALDEFWDKAQPILFLGEWCNPYKYNNKEVWKNCDFEIFNNANIAQDPDEVLIRTSSGSCAMLALLNISKSQFFQTSLLLYL